jgi:molybdate transport system substrate-binding protein
MTMRTLVFVVALLLLGPSASGAAEEITVSVAVSMKDAFEEIGRRFTQARPGVTPRFNFAASGALQKQIEAGAPVDVFVSAAAAQMDELEKQGLVVKGSRRTFAGNVLVAIAPADTRLDLSRPAALGEPRVTRIAVGKPRTVPAGQYAEESLRALKLWDRVRGKVVFAENVRQVLDYVSRGEVDVGFVYATDAATRAGRVKEAFRPAEDTHRPIVYPAAVVAASRRPALAGAFVDFLAGAEAQTALRRFGFMPAPAGSR